MTLPTLDQVSAATARPVPPVPGQLGLDVQAPLIGSFCTGYGGLDTAVQRVLGGSLAWVSDTDRNAQKILAHRHPGVPNIGDLTAADWHAVLDTFGRPHVVLGGYPCQPFSTAGRKKGVADARHLWPHIATALRVLRPRLAIFENVANHVRIGFDTVLRDLADLGFDAEWEVVRASDVGAAHQRPRLIFLAVAADAAHLGLEWSREARRRGARSAHGGVAAADADRLELGREQGQQRREAAATRSGGVTVPDADGSGRRADLEDVRAGEPDPQWSRYGAAIHRWGTVLGRGAPSATDVRGRLNPQFVEWLMGLPAGHVTDVPGLSRSAQLKALGNGVVPQQAEAAVRLLLDRVAQYAPVSEAAA